jgi:aromatic ring-opening dioxygenase catalytic subunit (LigB family)
MQLLNYTVAAFFSAVEIFSPQDSLPACAFDSKSSLHSYSLMSRSVAISVCHGGGPMPVMGDDGHKDLIKSMTERVPKILGLGTSGAPRAIVLITAHWSQRRPTISNAKKHKLFYDYSGFPSETYNLKYEAPGSPEVAAEVYEVLEKAGLSPEMDSDRGLFFQRLLKARRRVAD